MMNHLTFFVGNISFRGVFIYGVFTNIGLNNISSKAEKDKYFTVAFIALFG